MSRWRKGRRIDWRNADERREYNRRRMESERRRRRPNVILGIGVGSNYLRIVAGILGAR